MDGSARELILDTKYDMEENHLALPFCWPVVDCKKGLCLEWKLRWLLTSFERKLFHVENAQGSYDTLERLSSTNPEDTGSGHIGGSPCQVLEIPMRNSSS